MMTIYLFIFFFPITKKTNVSTIPMVPIKNMDGIIIIIIIIMKIYFELDDGGVEV